MRTLKVSLQVAFTICFSLFSINYSLAQTTIEVSGDITENTIWSDDTIKVKGDIVVEKGVALTINPGTYVEFQGYYELLIKGSS